MITKPELKKHLEKVGWREDSATTLIGEFGSRKLRVVMKERVFRVEELLEGKDGYNRFKRISSGKYKDCSIKDNKIIGMDRNI